MATRYKDLNQFDNVSLIGGNIAHGTVGLDSTIAYTIQSFSSADRTFAADEATTADVSATLATLISDLHKKGIITATGGE